MDNFDKSVEELRTQLNILIENKTSLINEIASLEAKNHNTLASIEENEIHLKNLTTQQEQAKDETENQKNLGIKYMADTDKMRDEMTERLTELNKSTAKLKEMKISVEAKAGINMMKESELQRREQTLKDKEDSLRYSISRI